MNIERFMKDSGPRWAVRLVIPLFVFRVAGWFIDTDLTEKIFRITLVSFFVPAGIAWCVWNILNRKETEVTMPFFGKSISVKKDEDPILFLAYIGIYWIVALFGSLFEIGYLLGVFRF